MTINRKEISKNAGKIMVTQREGTDPLHPCRHFRCSLSSDPPAKRPVLVHGHGHYGMHGQIQAGEWVREVGTSMCAGQV